VYWFEEKDPHADLCLLPDKEIVAFWRARIRTFVFLNCWWRQSLECRFGCQSNWNTCETTRWVTKDWELQVLQRTSRELHGQNLGSCELTSRARASIAFTNMSAQVHPDQQKSVVIQVSPEKEAAGPTVTSAATACMHALWLWYLMLQLAKLLLALGFWFWLLQFLQSQQA